MFVPLSLFAHNTLASAQPGNNCHVAAYESTRTASCGFPCSFPSMSAVWIIWDYLHAQERPYVREDRASASMLTLVVNVLVLMHFAVHV